MSGEPPTSKDVEAEKGTTIFLPVSLPPRDPARDFIKEEIKKDLGNRAIWFGIANVVALITLWVSVQSAAKEAASEEAKQTARLAVDTVNKSVGDAFTGALNKFLMSLSELELKKAELASGIKADQDEALKLQNALKDIKNARPEELATFFDQLNGDAKKLIPEVNTIVAELQNVYKYGIIVVDSDIAAAKLRNAAVNIDNITAVDSSEVAAGSADATAGGGLVRTQIDKSQSSPKLQLPKGSEVLASWGTTYGGTATRSYALTGNPSDPTKFEVLFSNDKNKDQGNLRVYVLYRTPLDTESSK